MQIAPALGNTENIHISYLTQQLGKKTAIWAKTTQHELGLSPI